MREHIASLIRAILETGHSYQDCAYALNAMGYRTPTGLTQLDNNVYSFIRNFRQVKVRAYV